VKAVGHEGRLARFRASRIVPQGRNQVRIAPQDEQEGQHAGTTAALLLQTSQRLEEDVDPLVVILVASGNDEDPCFPGELPAEKPGRRGKEFLPGTFRGRPGKGVVGNVLHVQGIGGDHIGGPGEEIFRLGGGNLAHRGEAVGLPGRDCFHGIFGGNVVGTRLPLGGEMFHHPVDVHPGTGKGTAEDRGMGRKHRSHLGYALFQIEQTGTGHPLVKVSDGGKIVGADGKVVDCLDHLPAGEAEHDGFHVIPAAGDGIDAEGLPEAKQKLVFVVFLAGAHQNRLGLPGYFPAAEATGDILDRRPFPYLRPAVLVGLLEIHIGLQIGSQKDIAVPIDLQRLPQLAGDYGVDAAHLVADLPAHLEQITVADFRHDPFSFPTLLEKSSRIFM